MQITKDQAFELAVKNIAKFGDTDIFPYQIDNQVFYDDPSGTIDILKEIDTGFDQAIEKIPLLAVKSLAAVGYAGFRWGTQIDPIWNAYLLSLVLRIGDDIERARVSIDKEVVFSYRYKPDFTSASVFDPSIGWHEFQMRSIDLARKYSYVLVCDISDFYPRIYHHRLENSLKRATVDADAIKRIDSILFRIAEHVSYGLPIGGPAARLLSELLLNRIDRLLLSEQIQYCRFVDDYRIFANSREEAYRSLVRLSELLLVNEGLSLQKTKTRILTSGEFLQTSSLAEENKAETHEEQEARLFSRLRLRYDPYSPNAEEEYEALKEELNKFDIVGMLGRQLTKSRIEEGLTRRLIGAVRHLPDQMKNRAVSSMFASLDILYPVFPAVMIVTRAVMADLDNNTQNEVFKALRDLISSGSYITQVPANLSFAIRVLVIDNSEETEAVLVRLSREQHNMMIKRDLILSMANRGADYWISNCRKQYSTLTTWERRALIVSSYILEDEGKHWRDGIRKELNSYDQHLMKWAGSKKMAQGNAWHIPI